MASNPFGQGTTFFGNWESQMVPIRNRRKGGHSVLTVGRSILDESQTMPDYGREVKEHRPSSAVELAIRTMDQSETRY